MELIDYISRIEPATETSPCILYLDGLAVKLELLKPEQLNYDLPAKSMFLVIASTDPTFKPSLFDFESTAEYYFVDVIKGDDVTVSLDLLMNITEEYVNRYHENKVVELSPNHPILLDYYSTFRLNDVKLS